MNIRVLRCRLNMTQNELAQALGVGQSTVANWEAGEYYPSSKLLPQLAKLFGCTIDELFEEERGKET